jgi:membrane carboxypeptidase/penicillin-binding protein PbpC
MLVRPERAGLVALPVCVLSGLKATPDCPSMVEWFVPGTEPQQADFWQVGGRTTLPPEYAEWAATNQPRSPVTFATAPTADTTHTKSERILSPLTGDRYEAPVGVDARYVSIPLVAGGAASQVRWFVDGAELSRARWQLQRGAHTIRARWPSGAQDSVRIIVD